MQIEYEGARYHVTARGNERRKIYFPKGDCQKFLEIREYLGGTAILHKQSLIEQNLEIYVKFWGQEKRGGQ